MTDLTRCTRCGTHVVKAHQENGSEVTVDAETIAAAGYHIERGFVKFCLKPHLHHRPHRCS